MGNKSQKCDILFLASTRSCLQFQWNRKYFFSAVRRLRGRLLMAPWHGFRLLDRGRWIFLHEYEGLLLDWLIFLLYLLQSVCYSKYSAKTTNFSILNAFLNFLHPFVLPYFGIFVTVPNVINVSPPSKVFHEGNLEENFINFVVFCLHGLVCWRLIVSK